MWAYRCALRSVGVDARLEITKIHKYAFPYDRLYDLRDGYGQSLFQELRVLLEVFRQFSCFDVFHFFSGTSFMHTHRDVPMLKFFNRKIVTTFIGTDVRCNNLVLNGEIDKDDCTNITCRRPCPLTHKRKLVKYWANHADTIIAGGDNTQLLDFYSIPYKILTVPCDTKYWSSFDTDFSKKSDELLIVHAPSNKKSKGTNKILSTIKRLQDEGYNIKFKLLHKVPNVTVREWLNVADIVIDRSRGFGWHGVLAVQSMAMGNPTVSYITDECRRRFSYGKALPLVSVEHKSLYDTLVELIEDPELRDKIGEESRSYVMSEHDQRKVGKDLLDVYLGIR